MSGEVNRRAWVVAERGETIRSKDGKHLIATAWHNDRPSESKHEGESWLDMRKRTQPERDKVQKEVEANARLIAAAPDLLAALEALEKAATDYLSITAEHFSDTDYDRDGALECADAELEVVVLPAARTALAKARGTS